MLPGIKIFDWQRVLPILKLLITGSKVKLQPQILDPFIFTVWRWSALKKGFDRGCKCFYTGVPLAIWWDIYSLL